MLMILWHLWLQAMPSGFQEVFPFAKENYPPGELYGILKMIFLFPRWDMLVPWRVTLWRCISYWKWGYSIHNRHSVQSSACSLIKAIITGRRLMWSFDGGNKGKMSWKTLGRSDFLVQIWAKYSKMMIFSCGWFDFWNKCIPNFQNCH